MRSLIDAIIRLLQQWSRSANRTSRRTSRRAPRRARSSSAPSTRGAPRGRAEPVDSGMVVEYSPNLDGDPDPGEVVWTWVPYEEDPSQGKDRPVVIIGRSGGQLIGVPLTSKQHDNEAQVRVGTGPWDPQRRPSYAKVERLLRIDPAGVRREGAILDRAHFDAIVAGVRQHHR